MWFWEKDSVEYFVFKKYEPASRAIDINFSSEDVQDALEANVFGLEDALKRTLEYVLWLQKNEKPIIPNAILIQALKEQWKPKSWHDDYLEIPSLISQGQRWWDSAAKMWGYDKRNQLVADVFYDNGKECIQFTNGKEMLVETAWRWGWERVLEYATT